MVANPTNASININTNINAMNVNVNMNMKSPTGSEMADPSSSNNYHLRKNQLSNHLKDSVVQKYINKEY